MPCLESIMARLFSDNALARGVSVLSVIDPQVSKVQRG